MSSAELSYIFSLCDVGQKGFITSQDILKVGSEYGPELGTILSILRLGEGDQLSLREFIARVNESSCQSSSPSSSSTLLEESELSCLSCPPSDYTSGFGSPISGEEDNDFGDLDASEVRFALRKLEDSLSVMKESQVDTREDLALILESVNQLDHRELNRRKVEREHQAELMLIRDKFQAELNQQKEHFNILLNEKVAEVQEVKQQLNLAIDEHRQEKELLRSEVESLKLVNVVLEQKLEYLRDMRSSENDEINRQWRQIQLDKDRLEDEKIEFGFEKLCLVNDSEDLQLEKREFHRTIKISEGSSNSSFLGFEDVFGSIQSENESLKNSFEESEFNIRELKKLNAELHRELSSGKAQLSDLKKKMDPLSSKSGLIGQFRDTLQRKKDSKARYTDILNSERQAHQERERELQQRNEDLSVQLSDIRRRRSLNTDRLKSPPPKCVITEADKEVNKQIIFEKKCLSLIIDELRSANSSLTDNLRLLEKENKKFRSQIRPLEDSSAKSYIQNINPRPRVFSSVSLKHSSPLKNPKPKSFSKSMSSLNIY